MVLIEDLFSDETTFELSAEPDTLITSAAVTPTGNPYVIPVISIWTDNLTTPMTWNGGLSGYTTHPSTHGASAVKAGIINFINANDVPDKIGTDSIDKTLSTGGFSVSYNNSGRWVISSGATITIQEFSTTPVCGNGSRLCQGVCILDTEDCNDTSIPGPERCGIGRRWCEAEGKCVADTEDCNDTSIPGPERCGIGRKWCEDEGRCIPIGSTCVVAGITPIDPTHDLTKWYSISVMAELESGEGEVEVFADIDSSDKLRGHSDRATLSDTAKWKLEESTTAGFYYYKNSKGYYMKYASGEIETTKDIPTGNRWKFRIHNTNPVSNRYAFYNLDKEEFFYYRSSKDQWENWGHDNVDETSAKGHFIFKEWDLDEIKDDVPGGGGTTCDAGFKWCAAQGKCIPVNEACRGRPVVILPDSSSILEIIRSFRIIIILGFGYSGYRVFIKS